MTYISNNILCLYEGYAHLSAGLCCGLSGLAAAEARRDVRTEQAVDSGIMEGREFEQHFAIELRAAEDTAQQVEDTQSRPRRARD